MANFPVYHGITLAANAYVENFHVELLAEDPVPIGAGRVWYNTTAKVFKQSTLDGTGAVIVRTFGTKEELDAAVATLRTDINTYITGNVSTINGRIDTEVGNLVTALSSNVSTLRTDINSYITSNVSTLRSDIDSYFTANVGTINSRIDTEVGNLVTALSGNITAVRDDIASNIGNVNTTIGTLSSLDTTDKTSVVNAINSLKSQLGSLGSAFNYVSTVNGGATTETAYDLSTLPTDGKDTGDYYKVATAGYFKVGAEGTPFYANTNDGLVWNSTSGIDKIDNTDSAVSSGDNDFISVTGSTDTGFSVNVGAVFAGRVSTLESGLTSEITRATSQEGNIITALSANVSTINSRVDTEVGNLVTALSANVSTINSRVDTEVGNLVTALSGNVSTINTRIDTEVGNLVTALSANVSTLNGTIGTLSELTTTTKGNVVAAINELSSLAAGGTAGVRTDYNATIWTFQSNAGATSHTLTHNLGNSFVDFGVMIQRANGSWYNDIASIEVVNNNSAILYLSTALNVRVIARSAATI
jgi:hypothetical protein